MRNFLEKHRWVMLAAVTLGFCVTNFPQGWAVFQPYIAQCYGYDPDTAAMIMPITVAFFGVFSIVGGRLQDKASPRLAGLIGGISVFLAFFNAWWLPAGRPLFLYLGFGLFFGGGCGFFYQALMATLMKWYADKMGFAGGLTGALAGVYLVAQTYLSEALLSALGTRRAMLMWGLGGLAVSIGVAALLVAPTSEYIAQKSALALPAGVSTAGDRGGAVDFTPGEMLRTPQFYLLMGSFILSMPALNLISPQLVTLCQGKGLSKELALSAVAVGSVSTAVGRLIVPILSDRVGRKGTTAAMWALEALAVAALMLVRGGAVVPVWALLTMAYYGGVALLSAFTNDMFGFANSGANMGIVNIYSTIGSVGGPALLALLTPRLGANAVYLIGLAGAVLALISILAIDPNTGGNKKRLSTVEVAS